MIFLVIVFFHAVYILWHYLMAIVPVVLNAKRVTANGELAVTLRV